MEGLEGQELLLMGCGRDEAEDGGALEPLVRRRCDYLAFALRCSAMDVRSLKSDDRPSDNRWSGKQWNLTIFIS